MNREAMKKNAISIMENNLVAAENGEDFSTVSIMDAERILEIADIKFTDEEMDRIETSEKMACKDIKEKYGLSWSEFDKLYDCQWGERHGD